MKSSYRLLTNKPLDIDAPEKMKGNKLGTWMWSQQFQVLAFNEKYGMVRKRTFSYHLTGCEQEIEV